LSTNPIDFLSVFANLELVCALFTDFSGLLTPFVESSVVDEFSSSMFGYLSGGGSG